MISQVPKFDFQLDEANYVLQTTIPKRAKAEKITL